jgi:hypothetical protein
VPDGELHPMLWRFNQLDDPRWRDVALRDAARAHTLVLAMSDEAAFCPRTQTWMTTLLSRLRGSSLTVLALIGHEEAWTITLAQPRHEAAAAPQAQAEFTSPAAEVFASVAPKTLRECAA